MNFPQALSRSVRTRYPSLALAGCLVASLGTAWAQGAAGSSTGSATTAPTQAMPVPQSAGASRNPADKSRLSRADRRFIEDAVASGQMEVQAAQLALTRASDKNVKDLASTMADQHGSANSELTQLAASLGVELPASPPRAMRNEVEKLGKRSGTEFDREFVREIGVKEHERDIKRFQKASKDVKEPELKAWIDKTLPTLQAHLAAAQKLPQAGSEAAASTKTQQQRMGAGANPSGGSMGTGAGSSSGSGSGGGTMPYGR